VTLQNEIEIARAYAQRILCDENHKPCDCSSHSRYPPDPATAETNLAQDLFLDAIRDRLIDEICAASQGEGHLPAVKLNRGFVLLSKRKRSQWTSTWDSSEDRG
jgi:hypothetical protein